MKRVLAFFLTFLLLTLLLACDSEDTSKINSGNAGASSGGVDSSTEDSGSLEKPDEEKDGVFKVRLEIHGEPFRVAEGEMPVTVVWSDGISYIEAEADENGVATAEGLDGNYTVTLKNLPKEYTYNPNPYNVKHKAFGNIVTNDEPEISIDVYRIGDTVGEGNDLFKRRVLKTTNVYRATLLSSEQKIIFEFAPTKSGIYTIESWLPVTDDKVNPKIDVYTNNPAAPIYQYTLDTGGAEGTSYTKNFKYEVAIADENISSSGGQVVFVFAVYATARNNKYFPVDVDFAVQYNGTFEIQHAKSEFVIPEEIDDIRPNLEKFNQDIEGKKWHNAATAVSSTVMVFMGDAYKYNEVTRVYHKYDEALYASDPYGYGVGYGPVLYADITEKTRTEVLDTAFNKIESFGNKALTVSNGTENYKLFIEGYSSDISNCPEELKGTISYSHASVVNKDGAVPVTEEIKQFLQKYAVSQLLFMDGDGWAESRRNSDGYRYNSTEDDQWLFACGYYE